LKEKDLKQLRWRLKAQIKRRRLKRAHKIFTETILKSKEKTNKLTKTKRKINQKENERSKIYI